MASLRLTPAEIVSVFKFFDENCVNEEYESLADSRNPFDIYFFDIFTVWREFLNCGFSYEIIEMNVVHFSCPGAELYRDLDNPWVVLIDSDDCSNILYMMDRFDDLVNGTFKRI
jgi:hypothetical protein